MEILPTKCKLIQDKAQSETVLFLNVSAEEWSDFSS